MKNFAPDALVGFHTGSYYHATDERGHPKAFRRGGRAHPIFSPHRAKVLHGPARGATLDDAAHFVHFTGRYLCGNQPDRLDHKSFHTGRYG